MRAARKAQAGKKAPPARKKPAPAARAEARARSQSEAAQAALAEAERVFRAQLREAQGASGAAARAVAHFQETLGHVPASVQALIDHAPGALAGYVALREFAYGGALDRRTIELLFAVLDVVEGHTEAAKAHAAEAMKAGLTVPQLAEALAVAMLVSGISTFAASGQHVLRRAAEFEATGL